MRKINSFPPSGDSMKDQSAAAVRIETTTETKPSVPGWFGEITLIGQHLKQQGVVDGINEGVRLARRRFGRYEVIDFVALLLGYASSGEGTLETYAERLRPFGVALMGLFGRAAVPHRSTLSRFLAAVEEQTVEALRGLFMGAHWLQIPSAHKLRIEYLNPVARYWLYSALQNITCSDRLRRDNHVGSDFRLWKGDRSEESAVA
jgi:hypothetical protein